MNFKAAYAEWKIFIKVITDPILDILYTPTEISRNKLVQM